MHYTLVHGFCFFKLFLWTLKCQWQCQLFESRGMHVTIADCAIAIPIKTVFVMLPLVFFLLCRTTVYLSRRIWTVITKTRYAKIICSVVLLFAIYHLVYFVLDYTEIRTRVDPHAVRGYTYCPVDEKRLIHFDQEYACDFHPMPNKHSDVIIFTFVNSAWITMARNWVCSAEKVGIKDHLFLIAFEPDVCSHFQDIRCYEHPKTDIHGSKFGEPDYQRLVIERTKVVLKLLSCHKKKLLLADADIVFLKNPLQYLSEITNDKDIVFQVDSSGVSFIDTYFSYFFHYICGGFIYMKPNNATKSLWLSVLHYQINFKWNDQAGLNICIRHHTQSCAWDTLKGEYFPNGMQYFDYKQTSENNMIVHANHLTDTMKIARMVASDVWCDRDVAVSMCKDKDFYHSECQLPDSTPEWCLAFVDICHNKYKVEVPKL